MYCFVCDCVQQHILNYRLDGLTCAPVTPFDSSGYDRYTVRSYFLDTNCYRTKLSIVMLQYFRLFVCLYLLLSRCLLSSINISEIPTSNVEISHSASYVISEILVIKIPSISYQLYTQLYLVSPTRLICH